MKVRVVITINVDPSAYRNEYFGGYDKSLMSNDEIREELKFETLSAVETGFKYMIPAVIRSVDLKED